MPSIIMSNVVMQSVVMLNAVMLSVIMLNAIMPSVIILNTILNTIMMTVILSNNVLPSVILYAECHKVERRSAECRGAGARKAFFPTVAARPPLILIPSPFLFFSLILLYKPR